MVPVVALPPGQNAAPSAALKAAVFERSPCGIPTKVGVEYPYAAAPFFCQVSWNDVKKNSLSALSRNS